jgi:hypothetical protein
MGCDLTVAVDAGWRRLRPNQSAQSWLRVSSRWRMFRFRLFHFLGEHA